MCQLMLNSGDAKGYGQEGLFRSWRGSRIEERRWVTGSRDPQRNSGVCQGYYRSSGFVDAAARAFFSLWKTS